jgi:uncharacterized protein YfaS (alpha-2-macroglobulin family)
MNPSKLLLAVLLPLLLLACTKDEKATVDDFSSARGMFVDLVTSHTAGLISTRSDIRLRLARDVEQASSGAEIDHKIFRFEPGIAGTAFWEDSRTAVFRPDKPLEQSTTYKARFHLAELLEVPDDKEEFRFVFTTLAQDFELDLKGMELYDATSLNQVKVTGQLITADETDNEKVEKMLSASQEGSSLSVTWFHGAGTNRHRFAIEDVVRREKASAVVVQVRGEPIDVERDVKEQVEIPSLSDFKVLNTQIVRGADSYISVLFSDPLLDRQNLLGFVTIKGMTGAPRMVTELNELKIYPSQDVQESVELHIYKEIKNAAGFKLKEDYSTKLTLVQSKPAVSLDDAEGSIIAGGQALVLPFYAIGLTAVDVTVVQVFEENMLQYLQVNELGGSRELRRVGRPVVKKTIPLEGSGVTDLQKRNRFAIDLGEIMKAEPGAIYQVQIGFRKSQSVFFCASDPTEPDDMETLEEDNWDNQDQEDDYWDYEYYYYEDYDWSQRDNPCSQSYYGDRRSVKKILFASNIGLIAKRNDFGDLKVFATDIATAKPMPGVDLTIYNFQQQQIGSGSTGSDGSVLLQLEQNPFVVMAKKDNQTGYLKVDDGSSLSLSNFNVTGQSVQKGLKGFIYGDRGVWRPGDTLNIGFILQDEQQVIPATQPVILELYNPQSQLAERIVNANPVHGLYVFRPFTSTEAPTGNWLAKVKVGGTIFQKTLKIEAVKPNRLKINLDFAASQFTINDRQISGDLKARWLHGAPARNLRAEFELLLTPKKTTFDAFPAYTFDDPSRRFEAEPEVIFEGRLNAEGFTEINVALPKAEDAPGALRAIFKGRVYEEGGDFSIDQFDIPYLPYSSFAGVQVPNGDKRGMLLTNQEHTVHIATVDAQGRPVSRSEVNVELYKLDWRWWWDNSWEDISNYVGREYRKPIKSAVVSTSNGKGTWKMRVDKPNWGRYFLRVTDPVSGHSSGQIVFIDWPGYAGKGGELAGATMLDITVEKEAYTVGEKVRLSVPGSAGGRVLLSLETGSRMLQHTWIDTEAGNTAIEFEATSDMTPNVFAHVMLIQPHAQSANDLPLRLYGVQSIEVNDPYTRLEPEISMPAELGPDRDFNIKITEKNGRPMTYTIAVVDEGLLDLTRFKTPEPWDAFYQREALGVKTWDLFDKVLGAQTGALQRLLSIGGDDEIKMLEEQPANRFKPVVIFKGPFHLKAGKSATHQLHMPQYVGSVRTMVVAEHESAYGHAEATAAVKQPLMILATLPRVAGPGEDILMPVNIFIDNNKLNSISLKAEATGKLKLAGQASQQVAMQGERDKIVFFNIKAEEAIGVGKTSITATGGGITAKYDVEMNVRASNPNITAVQDKLLAAGEEWTQPYKPLGLLGTNSGAIEVSSLPPLNLEQRLDYLVTYPHGCIEQTTSAAFGQLFIANLTKLDQAHTTEIEQNINAAIDKMKSFQLPSGAFSYWPTDINPHLWSTTYAGHFLIEARGKGYFVPDNMMNSWLSFQQAEANRWVYDAKRHNDLDQAYRLYALAKAGQPALGAMNRMKAMAGQRPIAQWRLALAYAVAGHDKEAKAMVNALTTEVQDYRERGGTFGSTQRDQAMILEVLVHLNMQEQAFLLLQKIARHLGDERNWMSTHTTAYTLLAVAKYAAEFPVDGAAEATVQINSKDVDMNVGKYLSQWYLRDADKAHQVVVRNNGKSPIYVRIIRTGVPLTGDEQADEQNLNLTITYKNGKGEVLDVAKLEQGTNLMAEVTVHNPGLMGDYEQMAITQIMPSGWEIINTRLDETSGFYQKDVPEYQDIRDDRVMTYFDLKAGDKKTFRIMLNASYMGRFYLPAVQAQAMYDNTISANTAGRWVEVVKAAE